MHSDFSLLDSSSPGTSSQPLADIAPAVSAMSSPKGASFTSFPAQNDEGRGLQGMTDQEREIAICRASDLVEFCHAEARLYEALWRRYSDFGHKAAFDTAYSNAHKAREIMESLIRGRSAEMVAYLERQRGLDLPACANEERGA